MVSVPSNLLPAAGEQGEPIPHLEKAVKPFLGENAERRLGGAPPGPAGGRGSVEPSRTPSTKRRDEILRLLDPPPLPPTGCIYKFSH